MVDAIIAQSDIFDPIFLAIFERKLSRKHHLLSQGILALGMIYAVLQERRVKRKTLD